MAKGLKLFLFIILATKALSSFIFKFYVITVTYNKNIIKLFSNIS